MTGCPGSRTGIRQSYLKRAVGKWVPLAKPPIYAPEPMRMSPAFHCTLKRLRFGANTVAIAVTLLSTVVTICLNDETKSPASAFLAVGFLACFALLWQFVRQDLQERDTGDAPDIT